MWTEARGQSTEQAHVAGVREALEMKWTGTWWAMKELGDLDGGNAMKYLSLISRNRTSFHPFNCLWLSAERIWDADATAGWQTSCRTAWDWGLSEQMHIDTSYR